MAKIEKEKINKKMKDEMKKAQKDAKKEMSEFKKFISKGNVVDMAVGVIIGGAFGKIVTSLVNDIITPAIGIIIGGLNFSNLSIQIGEAKIMYGNFIQTVIDFLIIAICIFSVIRIFERVKNRCCSTSLWALWTFACARICRTSLRTSSSAWALRLSMSRTIRKKR